MALDPIPKGKAILDSIAKHDDRRLLSSTDLIGQGVVEVIIDRVELVDSIDLDGSKKAANVKLMYFKNVSKPLWLKAVHIQSICAALETNIVEKWLGKKIKLAVKNVKAFGEMKPAIRVVG